MTAIGATRWAIAEGYIPGASTGEGPAFESHETACLLNAGDAPARVFAEDVSGGPAWGLRADYEHGAARVRLYGYLNRGLLALEAGTIFQEGDPRADYFTRTFLFRP